MRQVKKASAERPDVRIEPVNEGHAVWNVEIRNLCVRNIVEHLHEGSKAVAMRANQYPRTESD